MEQLKVTFTQNQTPYNELNVPTFNYKHSWFSKRYKFPFGLKFNQTYYKYENGGLVAFRILAYTICDERKNDFDFPLYFLVQLPNKPLQWIKDFIKENTNVYNSADDYILSGGSNNVSLNWVNWHIKFYTENVHNDTSFFAETFWTIKEGAVVKSHGQYCNRFVATEDGFFANIANASIAIGNAEQGIYLDRMVAIKRLLQDMSITDFENEPITIKMNVLDNTHKLLKIQFVE